MGHSSKLCKIIKRSRQKRSTDMGIKILLPVIFEHTIPYPLVEGVRFPVHPEFGIVEMVWVALGTAGAKEIGILHFEMADQFGLF